MTKNDNHLAKIEGESKEDRRRRLNLLAQHRHRARTASSEGKIKKSQPLAPSLPKNSIDELNKVLDDLKTFINTKATVRDLPKIKETVSKVPEEIQKIEKVKDCDDLKDKISERQKAMTEIEQKSTSKGLTPVQPGTIKKYLDDVNILYKQYIGHKESKSKKADWLLDCTDLDWTRDTKKVLDFITTNPDYSINTKSSRCVALASILKNIDGYEKEKIIYSEMGTKLKVINTAQRADGTLTESQQEKYLDWEVMEDKINEYKGKLTPKEKAIIAIYTKRTPRRLQDYSLMKLFFKTKSTTLEDIEDLDHNFNHVIIDSNGKPVQFVFNEYKTSKDYKQQVFDIVSDKLQGALKAYIKEQKLTENGQDLFYRDNSKKPYGSDFSSVVSKLFEKVTGKGMSVNILRHSFITYFLSKRPDDIFRAEAAFQMAHSVEIQKKYEVIKDREKFKKELVNIMNIDKEKLRMLESDLISGYETKDLVSEKKSPIKSKPSPAKTKQQSPVKMAPSPKKKKNAKQPAKQPAKTSPRRSGRTKNQKV